ncbi:BBSome complex assembly protein BBS10 [Eudromia elegans]
MAAVAAERRALARTAQEAAALAGAVRGCLGPRGGRALLALPGGAALPTRDGRRLLEALRLEPPTARLMVAAAGRLRAATGDGAKSFALLLAAVLRGLRAAGRRAAAARALRALAAGALPRAAAALRRHAAPGGPGAALEALLEAYLGGRAGPAERRPLARLGRGLCERCPPRVAAEHWGALHAAAAGLPLARSRLLAGLLLAAVVVAQPLHAGPGGAELALRSEAQAQAWQRHAARGAEAVVRRLHRSGVRLLLAAGRQHEAVVYFAERHGITLVECLSPEEIALLCHVTGVAPFSPHGAQGEVTDVAVAAFCRPLLLGSERYVHVGFSSACAFQPHCLVLCGPAPGVIEQHADALHGALKMLEQLSETVEQRQEGQTAGACGHHPSTAQKQLPAETVSCGGSQGFEHHLRTAMGEAGMHTVESSLEVSENPACEQTDVQVPSRPLSPLRELSALTVRESSLGEVQKLHTKWKHSGDIHEDCASNLVVDSPESSACTCSRQNYSSVIIEAGSVLPVGGNFEILLHYYLHHYAKECQEPLVAEVAHTVADALLSIPQALYSTAGRNSFNKFYLRAMDALRKNEPLPASEKGLESVYCKYQLVLSVLSCAAELLTIDCVIGVRRPLRQKTEGSDSEDDDT